jgi:hypothetical protein
LFGAAALLLAAAPAAADPAFKRLVPLLVDLPGFTGQKPDGMTMEMGEGALTTASRKYAKPPATIDVVVTAGAMAAGAMAPLMSGMKYETTEGHMIPAEIAGFKVLKTWNESEKSGALLVALDKASMLTFSYRGIAEDEAVGLAQKLDWKGLAAAAK